jgi:hypothetical protein
VTTFKLISKKTGLVLSAAPNSTQLGEVVQLAANEDTANNFWRFFVDVNLCFQIINAQTQMALATAVFPGFPVWNNTSHQGVETPVMEVSVVDNTTVEAMAGFGFQEWTVQAPSPGSASFGLPYFELVVQPLTASPLAMNVPDHLLGGDNVGVAIQATPGNGGQDNEQWTLANTTSPQPAINFTGTSVVGYTDGWYLNFAGGGYIPGTSVNVVSLALPGRGVVGVTQGRSIATVDSNGNVFAKLYLPGATGSRVPGVDPNDAQVTVAALDENGFAMAFTTISSSYWYTEG